MRVAKSQLGRLAVHQRDERGLVAGDALGEGDRGIVPRGGDDAVQQVADAHLLARRQEHGRAGLVAVPALPGLGPHRAHPVGPQLAAVDQVEDDVGGHHLRHRRRRDAPVRILGVEHRARAQVDHVGDRRRSFVGRRGGGGGEAKSRGEKSEIQGLARHLSGRNPRTVSVRPNWRAGRWSTRRSSSNYSRGWCGSWWSADRPCAPARRARARKPGCSRAGCWRCRGGAIRRR